MSTSRTYQDMLNEYLPNDLFKDELMQRDWYLSEINKDNSWKGGDIIVPFQGAAASSVRFGKLTSDTDISEYKYVRGKIQGYKEVWGSLVFNETDIMQHDGRVNEQSFLRILPDQIEEFMQYMKVAVSLQLMTGPHFAKVTDSTNAATGVMVVNKIDRFEIGQKAFIQDDNTAVPVAVYATGININLNEVTFSLTRGGAAANLSAFTAAQNAKLYHDGVLDPTTGALVNQFVSAKSALLSAANGGSATLHGQTKTAYPALQAINIDGSAISSSNILAKLFDAWNTIKIKAKAANPSVCVLSFRNMGYAMALIEQGGGIHQVIASNPKITKYGWTEIQVTGVKGGFKIVGIQEMDDDIIMFLDMSAMTFRTNGFFMKKKSPEGLEYYRIRSEDGFKLVTDICLFGEQEFRKPASCGIVHSIP